jgi:hypothetical protein
VTDNVASRKKPLERHYNGDNSQNYNNLVGGFMSLGRRVIHPRETYRFSTTHTLSDYPLLIGEILRRDQQRAAQQDKRQTFLYGLGRALGMRVHRALGSTSVYHEWTQLDERNRP